MLAYSGLAAAGRGRKRSLLGVGVSSTGGGGGGGHSLRELALPFAPTLSGEPQNTLFSGTHTFLHTSPSSNLASLKACLQRNFPISLSTREYQI